MTSFMQKALINILLLSMVSTIPVLAFGPTNARLHGFGGAGVAVAPRDGQAAMSVNPAAPGFLEQGQVNLNFNYGDRIETGKDIYGLELTDHPKSWSGGLEGYWPFNRVTVFGGVGTESESVDWHLVLPGEGIYLWGDGRERSTTINLGAAGAFHDMVALGGQWLTMRRSLEEEGRGYTHEFSDSFNSGEVGVLVMTPAQVNFGLTWRSEDSNDEALFSNRALGINEMLRVGAAFQKKEGNWLVGVEYVNRRQLSLGDPTYLYFRKFEEQILLGEERVHVYGEYRLERLSVRAGLCRSRTDKAVPVYNYGADDYLDYDFDTDRLIFSFGLSGHFSDSFGWEFFLQRVVGDSVCHFETFDRPVYDYEDKALRVGFGVTFLFGRHNS